ncbi:GNAT family N-acetyltransferase [Pontibacillus sp. ALD_SL1]|uniref:GNAT family N-acetyltransferase n=1 Tax=Pontibacillus sp. ALD_SL1 TaxID=2777185 RepID=UPI001A958497|nr:GNAT family N-acetyltransferase [Pontibacillus sp. ALD_SL1]QSS99761.1 GNAT family N-acetyltransferase [Pontibacillus sp. ALD_SL1]
MLSHFVIEPIESFYNDESDWMILQSFLSTNTSIDNFLRQEAYYKSIEFQGNTSLLLSPKKDLIGYFTLVDSTIEFPDLVVPCIEVAKLAVQEDYQEQGIGTYLLEEIARVARQTNHRYLTLDALFLHYMWYQKRGFFCLDPDEVDNHSDLIYMCHDLYDEDVVSHFLEE